MFCQDCQKDLIVIRQYHIQLKDTVWKLANADLLCLSCIENRIGRELTQDDFKDASHYKKGKMRLSASALGNTPAGLF